MSGRKLLTGLSLVGLLTSVHAKADLGFVRLDDESYYLRSDTRPDNTLALVFGPDVKTTGSLLTAHLELEGYVYVNDLSSFEVESQELYVATSPELSSRHQITLGRRNYDWSVADDVWKLGTWTPRFNWDPLNPEQVGNTGLFYTYETDRLRVLAFGSYVSVPERGVPLNSNLTSPSGDWVSPFSQVNLPALNNVDIPVQYSIEYPSTSALVFHPSAALQLRYGGTEGFRATAEYGYMPIHQADLLVEGILPAQAEVLDVTIHPVILMQHLITAEVAYKAANWSLWGSATREIPINDLVEPSSWIQQPIGPANILAAGGDWDAFEHVKFSGSFLSIDEALPQSGVPNNLSLNLPSRFPYTEAFQVGVGWNPNQRWTYRAFFIDDITNVSELLSLDVGYRPQTKSSWFLGLGTDFIASSTEQGMIGQFEGNDRVRVRVAYAF